MTFHLVQKGTHADLPVVTMRRFRRMVIRATPGSEFQFELDGDLIPDAVSELTVETPGLQASPRFVEAFAQLLDASLDRRSRPDHRAAGRSKD